MRTVVLVWRVYRGVAAFGLVNRHDQISECEATVSECDSVRFRATAAKTAQAVLGQLARAFTYKDRHIFMSSM